MKKKNEIRKINGENKKAGFSREGKTVRGVTSALAALALTAGISCVSFADGTDPITVVNNLSDFIFGLIRAVGIILLGWGIVQVGLSLQSHDPSQRSN